MSLLRCLLPGRLENSFIFRKPSRGIGSTRISPDSQGSKEVSHGFKGLPNTSTHLASPGRR